MNTPNNFGGIFLWLHALWKLTKHFDCLACFLNFIRNYKPKKRVILQIALREKNI